MVEQGSLWELEIQLREKKEENDFKGALEVVIGEGLLEWDMSCLSVVIEWTEGQERVDDPQTLRFGHPGWDWDYSELKNWFWGEKAFTREKKSDPTWRCRIAT